MSDVAYTPSRLHQILNWIGSLAVLSACVWGYTFLGERSRPERKKPPRQKATAVVTEPLQMHRGNVSIQANGVVVPLREIQLAAEVSGRAVAVSENLRPGKMVSRGELLIKIDEQNFDLELRRLRAQQSQEAAELKSIGVSIENLKDLLRLAEEQVALAKNELIRVAALVDRQAASATESDAARRTALSAQTSVVELHNQRRDLESQRETLTQQQKLTAVAIERAQLDLNRSRITAPITGRVVQTTVEDQSYVQAGVPFVVIEDTSAVEVRVNLTASQMKWVWASQSSAAAQVTADVIHESDSRVFQWNAVLERIDGVGIDTATRTYPCLFRVDQPQRVDRDDGPSDLRRGMFVTVQMSVDPNRILYQVTELAIRPGNRVWVNEGGKLRIVPIEVVSRSDGRVVVALERPTQPPFDSMVGVIVSPISDPIEGMDVQSDSPSPPKGRLGYVPREMP